MSVEQLLIRFIYREGQVQLHGIGTISLSGAIPDDELLEKNRNIPVQGLAFTTNKTEATTPAFIEYYARERGKTRYLAQNDIDAYLSVISQFLNIGSTYEIKGLGTLSKLQDSSLAMKPGMYIPQNQHPSVRPGLPNLPVSLPNIPIKKIHIKKDMAESAMKIFFLVIVCLLLLAGAWWGYHRIAAQGYFSGGQAQADTVKTTQTLPETRQDSAAITKTATASELSWKAVFRQINGKEKALRVYSTMTSKIATPIFMETSDSVVFNYYVLLKSSLEDTARRKDSVRIFFGRPITLLPVK